ncbi:MAG: hypothetical protein HFI63_02400 [Lachnospiraceae bacterium]|nr:hypothetical protein [Lachnospiraceae bacterium]
MPGQTETEKYFGYARGRQIAMEEVKDDVFGKKMLGDGVAVLPEEGNVYAPADGTVVHVFDTKHAICFVSRYKTEILIHIGVDTVKLEGKYFTVHVENGMFVKRGQLLIEFDKEQMERDGYDTTIPMIFTALPKEKRLEIPVSARMSPDKTAALVHRLEQTEEQI